MPAVVVEYSCSGPMGTTLVRPEPLQAPPLSGVGMSSASATIGQGVKIFGQISSKEDLYVNGEIEGTLVVLDHKLTIGPSATVNARVKAREVVLLGTVQGKVDATDKVEIRKDARLIGDIRTPRIIIEDGAYFKGSIDIIQTNCPSLALVGSNAADAADDRAEQDIRERRYITLDDTNSLSQVLSKFSDQRPGSQAPATAAPGQAPTSATWSRR
jgi:cytoskeletal protein CcmA (bactofilin family)